MVAMQTPDYEALMLAAIAAASNHKKWLESKFEGVKTISNTHVGRVGQDFVESICQALDLPHEFPMLKERRLNQSPWDIRIFGKTFELKTATEDTQGCFQFNHIRYHRPYEAVLCIGVAPNEVLFGCWSKADIVTGKAGRLVSMEQGANASYKFPKRPADLLPISMFETKLRSVADTI
jgi:hypothetical protein